MGEQRKKHIDIGEVKKLYTEYGNLHRVGEILHISHVKVRNILLSEGEEIKKVGNEKIFDEKTINNMIEDYFVLGLRFKDIGAKYHLTEKKLRTYFKNRGLLVDGKRNRIKNNKNGKIRKTEEKGFNENKGIEAKKKLVQDICSLLKKNGLKSINDFKTKNKIDIFVSDQSIAFKFILFEEKESQRLQLLKELSELHNKGIMFFPIFEDEFLLKRDLIIDKIEIACGIKSFKKRCPGRKTIIEEIKNVQAETFLEKNHIQGFVSSTVYLGAFYDNELVSVMSFLNEKNGEWNLTRFCTNNEYSCPGVASKIFKYFVKKYNPESIKSFLDYRWCRNRNDNLYTKMGFIEEKLLQPDYRYIVPMSQERHHKFGFRKNILLKKYPDKLNANMTETEMAKALGYDRIWDCGLIKYVWTKENPGD